MSSSDPVSSEIATADDAELADVLEAYLRDAEAGRPLDEAALLAAHAHIAHRLRDCLESLRNLGGGFPHLHSPRPIDSELPKFADYRVVRQIARGGMGAVYEAEQLSLQRTVALKVLPLAGVLDPRQLKRFRNEALATAQLDHPHIVKVYHVGCENGVHFYAMQFVPGFSLAEVLRDLRRLRPNEAGSRVETELPDARDGEMPSAPFPDGGSAASGFRADSISSTPHIESHVNPVESRVASTRWIIRNPRYVRLVARLGIQAAEALHHAHEAGVVHRDIKPSNLLVDTSMNLWVTDFGLARIQRDVELTLSGDLLGTLRYMSPEQSQGRPELVDHRTDVYSLGATLYELLTLRPLLDGESPLEVLRRGDLCLAGLRTLNPAVPEDLETVVLKSLEAQKEDRYASAGDFAADLRRFLDDAPVLAQRPTLFQRLGRWARRNRTWLSAAAIFLAFGIVGLAASSALIYREWRKSARAELETQEQLYRSLLSESRATRRSNEPGRRDKSWQLLDSAIDLRRALGKSEEHLRELRSEAIAILQLDDVRPETRLFDSGKTIPDSAPVTAIDGPFARYTHIVDDQGTISVRSVADGRELVTLPGAESATVRGFSPGGRYLCVFYRTGDGWIGRVWDLPARQVVLQWEMGVVRGAVDFHPGDRLFAAALGDGRLRVHDLETNSNLSEFSLPEPPQSIAFRPTSGEIAATESDQVVIYDWQAGKLLRSLGPHDALVENVVWCPDGVRVISAAGRDLYQWNGESGDLERRWRAHRQMGVQLDVSRSGRWLVSSSWHGDSQVWDLFTESRPLPIAEYGARSIDDLDERVFTFSSQRASVWHVERSPISRWLPTSPDVTEKFVRELFNNVGMAFSPVEPLLAISTQSGVYLWHLDAQTPAFVIPMETALRSAVAFDPVDGSLLVSGYGGLYRWPVHNSGDHYRIGPPRALLPEWCHTRLMTISPDGSILAVAHGQHVHVLDLRQGTEVCQLREHRGVNLQEISIHPQGRWIATSSWGGKGIRISDGHSGEHLRTLLEDERNPLATFIPGGQWLNVHSFAVESQLWNATGDPETWGPVASFPARSANFMSFRFDGQVGVLPNARETESLVSIPAMEALADLDIPPYLTRFNPQGDRLATAHPNLGVQVWDLRSIQRELLPWGLNWEEVPGVQVDSQSANREVHWELVGLDQVAIPDRTESEDVRRCDAIGQPRP